jgi:hypothetical protein
VQTQKLTYVCNISFWVFTLILSSKKAFGARDVAQWQSTCPDVLGPRFNTHHHKQTKNPGCSFVLKKRKKISWHFFDIGGIFKTIPVHKINIGEPFSWDD